VTQGADPRNPEVRTTGWVYGSLDLSNGSESSHIMLRTKIRIQSTEQNLIVRLLIKKNTIKQTGQCKYVYIEKRSCNHCWSGKAV